MNALLSDLAFRRNPASTREQTNDAITRALAKIAKSPAQLENDKRLFRFRARRDARAVMRSVRNEQDLLNRLSLSWRHEVPVDAPTSIDQAIACLEFSYRSEKSLTGTPHANGHSFMAVRSRLIMGRYYRRFGSKIWETV